MTIIVSKAIKIRFIISLIYHSNNDIYIYIYKKNRDFCEVGRVYGTFPIFATIENLKSSFVKFSNSIKNVEMKIILLSD